MSVPARKSPWVAVLGLLNALALAVLLTMPQPAVADGGVDACPVGATGCACLTDTGSPFVPDGCHQDDGLMDFRCHAGSQCVDEVE